MKAIDKTSIAMMKDVIKESVEKQKSLKNQRKTKNLIGERTMEPGTASWKYSDNKQLLRIMYAAYGLMRGKAFSQTENKFPEEDHPLKEFQTSIDKMVESYMVEIKEEIEVE